MVQNLPPPGRGITPSLSNVGQGTLPSPLSTMAVGALDQNMRGNSNGFMFSRNLFTGDFNAVKNMRE
jgi:hypothetical protein